MLLAACSFEAYLDPEPPRSLQQVAPNGCAVAYMDKTFLQSSVLGLLRFEVLGTEKVPSPTTSWPGDDMYVRMSTGTSSTQALVDAKSLPGVSLLPSISSLFGDPAFGASLYIRNLDESVEVTLYRTSLATKEDEVVGRGTLSLRDLVGRSTGWNQEVDVSLRLSPPAPTTEYVVVSQTPDGERDALHFSPELRADKDKAAAPRPPGAALSPTPPPAVLRFRAKFTPMTEALASTASRVQVKGSAPSQESAALPLVGLPPKDWAEWSWKAFRESRSEPPLPLLEPIAFVENAGTSTEAWVYRDLASRTLCVAFRGTKEGNLRDMLTDVLLVPAKLEVQAREESKGRVALAKRDENNERHEAQEGARFPFGLHAEPGLTNMLNSARRLAGTLVETHRALLADARERDEQERRSGHADGEKPLELEGKSRSEDREKEPSPPAPSSPHTWVHHGFLTAYASVRPQLLQVIGDALEEGESAGDEAPWTVLLTGHSLGGALATLCAGDLASSFSGGRAEAMPVSAAEPETAAPSLATAPPLRPRLRPTLRLYTFGSPRVGNKAYARWFDDLVRDVWRVVNGTDAVASVPRLVGYRHVGHGARLGPGGELELSVREPEGDEAELGDLDVLETLPALWEVSLGLAPDLAGGALDAAWRSAKAALGAGAAAAEAGWADGAAGALVAELAGMLRRGEEEEERAAPRDEESDREKRLRRAMRSFLGALAAPLRGEGGAEVPVEQGARSRTDGEEERVAEPEEGCEKSAARSEMDRQLDRAIALCQAEVEAWTALLQTSAIEQHLEDSYLEALRAAATAAANKVEEAESKRE